MKKLETSLGSKSAEPNSIENAQIFKGKKNCLHIQPGLILEIDQSSTSISRCLCTL